MVYCVKDHYPLAVAFLESLKQFDFIKNKLAKSIFFNFSGLR